MSESLQPYELQPTRLFCPWNSPGKNTRMDFHALLEVFPNSRMELVSLNSPTLANGLFTTSPPGKPNIVIKNAISDDHFSMTGFAVGTK